MLARMIVAMTLLALLSPHSSAEPATKPAAAKERTFTNKKHKVRFKVPGTMAFERPDVTGMIAQYRPKPAEGGEEVPFEFVQMMVLEEGKPIPGERLKDIIGRMQERVEKDGGKVDKSEPTALGGADAHGLRWSGDLNGKPAELKQVVCIRGGKAYVLTFIAEQGKLDDFVKRAHVAVDSFEWLE